MNTAERCPCRLVIIILWGTINLNYYHTIPADKAIMETVIQRRSTYWLNYLYKETFRATNQAPTQNTDADYYATVSDKRDLQVLFNG